MRRIVVMLRSLLVGMLTVAATAGCKDRSAAPAVQPGVAAGTIVELAGRVTATRGAETRALARGAEVSGDDVIETGADGHVVILLAHNNARWQLGANKQAKVAGSLAWNAPKQDGPAAQVEEATTAAGRHAERAGAETGATAMEEGGAAAAAPIEQSKAAPGAAPAAAAPATAGRRDEAEPPRKERRRAVRAADNPAEAAAPEKEATLDTAAPPPAPPVRRSRGIGLGGDLGLGGAGGGGPGGGGPAATGAPADDAAEGAASPQPIMAPPPPPPDPARELRIVLAREQPALRACLDASAPKLNVRVTVTRGKATIAAVDPATDQVKACLAAVAARLELASTDQPTTVSLTITR